MILFAAGNREDRLRFLDLFLDECKKVDRHVLLLGDGIGAGRTTFPRVPLPEGSSEELEQAMTALLNHDPDIIAMADATPGRAFLAAWRSALRDRIVVAGIDRDDLGSVFDYLISARRENRSVVRGLRGLVAVTGVRTLCTFCREAFDSSGAAGLPEAETLYRSRGCPECGYSGVGGMRYLVDVVPIRRELQEAFAEARESSGILRSIAMGGYRGITGELDDLLLAGEISPEEYSAVKAR